MDALVDGKTGYLAEVMVGMGADGTDPVGAECQPLRVSSINLAESVFAAHNGMQEDDFLQNRCLFK